MGSQVFQFRLNPDDPDDGKLIKWLDRQSKGRGKSKVIRRALRDAMKRKTTDADLARAVVVLADKLEAGGLSPEQVADVAGLPSDYMAHMRDVAQVGKRAE